MRTSFALVAACVVAASSSVALAAPSSKRATTASTAFAVKERHEPPLAWTKMNGAIPDDHQVRMTFGLKSSNFEQLEEHLSQAADPDNDRYGSHLSADEANAFMAPSKTTIDTVVAWLEGHGVPATTLDWSPAKDWISVRLPLRKIEAMLDTKYAVYEHRHDGSRLVRTSAWSLPAYLHEHIDVVQPTNSFFRPLAKTSSALLVDTFPLGFEGGLPSLQQSINSAAGGGSDGSGGGGGDVGKVCNESFVTPQCLRTFYGTIDYKAQAADRNSMGLNNFLGQVNNRSDTGLFLRQFRPEAEQAAYTFKTEVINGGNNYQGQENATRLAAGADIEGDLDSETMLGIAWPTKLTTFNTGGMPPFRPDATTPTDTNEPYLDWLNAVLRERELPHVISTSYADDEQTVPLSYARKVCAGFALLGARGISLFFGSGDAGVGKSGQCLTNDGKNASTFLASFPSTCPYITSVGGTRNFNPEIAAYDDRNGYVTGGGFSRYFRRPRYQDAAVQGYAKQSLGVGSGAPKFQGLYNPEGRGYPDVAAQSYRFAIVWNGTVRTVDGTSAATPAFAAVAALVNDALLAAGRPTLGFLNPWLYAKGFKGLRDITIGSATGCNSTGFPAAPGWDAVTGFGTPDFKQLVRLAKDSAKPYSDANTAMTGQDVADDGSGTGSGSGVFSPPSS